MWRLGIIIQYSGLTGRMIPTAVWETFEYWLPLRNAEMQMSRAAVSQKVSRNAPCYSGSGKKFKKCCGSVAEA